MIATSRRCIVPLDVYPSALAPMSRRKCMWYDIYMTKSQVKEVLDRVLTWPEERQKDVIQVLSVMEKQDKNPYRLTDAQVAEVRRRRAKKNPKYITLAEARKQFRRRRI